MGLRNSFIVCWCLRRHNFPWNQLVPLANEDGEKHERRKKKHKREAENSDVKMSAMKFGRIMESHRPWSHEASILRMPSKLVVSIIASYSLVLFAQKINDIGWGGETPPGELKNFILRRKISVFVYFSPVFVKILSLALCLSVQWIDKCSSINRKRPEKHKFAVNDICVNLH